MPNTECTWSTVASSSNPGKVACSPSVALVLLFTPIVRAAGRHDAELRPSDFWQVPLNDTISSKTKQAQLLAAFMAGKNVSLRCENSLVSDFQIFE